MRVFGSFVLASRCPSNGYHQKKQKQCASPAKRLIDVLAWNHGKVRDLPAWLLKTLKAQKFDDMCASPLQLASSAWGTLHYKSNPPFQAISRDPTWSCEMGFHSWQLSCVSSAIFTCVRTYSVKFVHRLLHVHVSNHPCLPSWHRYEDEALCSFIKNVDGAPWELLNYFAAPPPSDRCPDHINGTTDILDHRYYECFPAKLNPIWLCRGLIVSLLTPYSQNQWRKIGTILHRDMERLTMVNTTV